MNTTDPLAQLRDIHLPDPVSFWPLAWGWWLLLALLVTAAGVGLFLWLRHRRRNRYRLQASAELETAQAQYRETGNTAQYLQDLSVILRRAALTAFPASRVASLHGHQWLDFLDATLPGNQPDFSRGAGQVLLSGPYQPHPDADVDALHKLARRWLAKHSRKLPHTEEATNA